MVDIRRETSSTKTFTLELGEASPFWPGQHYIVRLTAPDGYRAQRSYSVASAPSPMPLIDLTVELLPDGEVSSFLHETVQKGDRIEVRGPIGGHFAWNLQPAVGLAGGSGVVPLMSMLRHARGQGRPDLFRLMVSVKRPDELIYDHEMGGPETTIIYSQTAPSNSVRPPGRIRSDDLVSLIDTNRDIYVCGSTAFCDAVTFLIIEAGVAENRIKVERFGFSG